MLLTIKLYRRAQRGQGERPRCYMCFSYAQLLHFLEGQFFMEIPFVCLIAADLLWSIPDSNRSLAVAPERVIDDLRLYAPCVLRCVCC